MLNSSPLNKPWIRNMIREELLECEPLLELDGVDIDVINLCTRDSLAFAEYLHKKYTEIPNTEHDIDVVIDGKVIGNVIDMEFDFDTIKGAVTDKVITNEVKLYVHQFVRLWWKKYKERIRISFKLPKSAIDAKNPNLPTNIFTKVEQKEITDALEEKFIQYGEVCCPSILALNVFASALRHTKKTKWSLEDKVNLRSVLLREVKHVAYSHGPLIFIKPDMKKLLTFMKEYRDDGSTKII